MESIEELKARREELATSMKTNHLAMARSLAKGSTQGRAYIDAGFEGADPRRRASDIIRSNPDILEYADLSKEIAAYEAQEALSYDEERWLRDQLGILQLSLGEKERVETVVAEGGGSVEVTYKKVDLTAANKSQEMLGKRLGIFSETLNNAHSLHDDFVKLMRGSD